MSCSSVYCISGTNSDYDGSYSTGDTLHNGYIYYTGDTTPTYFIFYSTGGTESNWCLSTALDGPCLLFGKSPCLSDCPDLCTEFFSSGTCPAPTPSATPVCDVDFTAVLECSISPTPTQTPSQTPTQTPTPTPTPSDVCGGVSMVVSGVTYTPTPTPTISLTPSSTPDVTRPCSFSGTVAFNTLDDYIRCANSKKFRDCSNGFLYHSSELILDEFNEPIQIGYVYKATINEVSVCVVYDGLVDNISGADDILIIENIGLEIDNGCNNCVVIPTPTPTPTPSTTPSVILNNYFATRTCNPGSAVIEVPSSFVDAFAFTANDGNCYQIISETNESPTLIATNTGCTACVEYLLEFDHPGYAVITYSPCCPIGNTITQYITPNNDGLTIQDVEDNIGIVVDEVIEGAWSFTFTSNSGYVIAVSPSNGESLIFGGGIQELGTTCPCEEELTFKCLNINVTETSEISWVDYTGTLQTNTYTPGPYSILCGLEDSVTSSNGPSSFQLFVGGDCTDDNPCYT